MATSIYTFAQDAPRNSRIASAETSVDAEASRFIEGISLEAPSVVHRSSAPSSANNTDNNTVANRHNNNNNNRTSANNNRRPSRTGLVAPEMVDDEPAPAFKDKQSAKAKLAEGLRRNPQLYGFIQEWYGTPYRLGGTSKRAIDCSAFTRQLFLDVFGQSLERTAAMQFMMTKRIYDKNELKEGDLVFFSIKTKRISHCGVYLGDGKFVHASSSQGVVISDLNQPYWTRYYAGAGRL